MSRPAKLPFAAWRVVKACLMLIESHKLLWGEHVALDGPDGAFISATHMAQRIGMSARSVERGRAELVRLGMLTTGRVNRGKTATWFPTLPPQCIPLTRPTVAEVAHLAEQLDRHIRAVRGGMRDPEYLTPKDLTADSRDATPDTRVGPPPTPVTDTPDTGDVESAPPSAENRAQSADTGVGGESPEVGEVQVGEYQAGETPTYKAGEPVFDGKAKTGEQRVSQDGNGGSLVSVEQIFLAGLSPAQQAEYLRYKARNAAQGKAA